MKEQQPMPTPSDVVASSVPYTLRIGVTGHRSLRDAAAVERAARALFDRLRAAIGQDSAGHVQWRVVSALARGADRCVARAAIDSLGAQLEFVAPMPLEEYRRDFAEEADRAEFEQLLKLGVRDDLADEVAIAGLTEPAQRNQAYLAGGRRLVDVSEIIVAVWNGQRAAGVGGTADIVQYALEQGRLVLWLNAEAPDSPVQVVRQVVFTEGGAPGPSSIEVEPLAFETKALSPALHQHRAYCRDAAVGAEELRRAAQRELERLAATATTQQDPSLNDAVAGVANVIVPHFVRADLLALHYQQRYQAALRGVLCLGAAAITIALVELLFFPGTAWLLMLDAAAMATALGVWLWSRKQRFHAKWLHDRYLAEHLRVLLFTTLVAPPGFSRTVDERLPFYRGPRQWLPALLTTIGSLAAPRVAAQPPARAIASFTENAWLNPQTDYNVKTAEQKERRAKRRHRAELTMLGVAFVAVVLHAFGVGHSSGNELPPWARIEVWISFLGLALIPWAGVVHALSAQLELDKIAERSRRMVKNIQAIKGQLAMANTHAEVQRVVNRAAELMTSENHEWWVLLSFQEMRLHA